MKKFSDIEWDRANKTLVSAKQLLQTDPDSSASRSYYAAFHALTSWFARQGNTFTKHSSLRSALHRDLIKTGKLPRELGSSYDFLLEIRETGDYGGVIQVTREDAELAIAKAEYIIETIKKILSTGPCE